MGVDAMSKKHIIGIISFVILFFGAICWFSYMHITGADIEFIAKLDEADYVNATVQHEDAFTGEVISSETHKLDREQIKELHGVLVSSGFFLDFGGRFSLSPKEIRTDIIIYGSFTNDEEGYYIYCVNGDFVDVRLKNGAMLIPINKDFQNMLLGIIEK